MSNFDDLFDPQPQEQPAFDKDSWAERKQNERQEVYALADKTALEVGADGDKFKAFLDVKSRLIHYSATNALLVLSQHPLATQLRDFDGWKKEGVSIKRGENHIKILEAGKSYAREDGSVGTGWKIKHVFDVSQTTAKPKTSPSISYDDRVLLKALIAKAPVPIQGADELPGNMGAYFDSQKQTIFVRRGMDAHDIVRSLSKELAHAELALTKKDYSRENSALAAYSVSYIVSKRYGVDVSGYDFSMVPESVKNTDVQSFRTTLNEICDVSKEITGRMNKALEHGKPSKGKEQER